MSATGQPMNATPVKLSHTVGQVAGPGFADNLGESSRVSLWRTNWGTDRYVEPVGSVV